MKDFTINNKESEMKKVLILWAVVVLTAVGVLKWVDWEVSQATRVQGNTPQTYTLATYELKPLQDAKNTGKTYNPQQTGNNLQNTVTAEELQPAGNTQPSATEF